MLHFKVYFWKNMPRDMFKDIKEAHKDRLKDYMDIYVLDTHEEMYSFTDKKEHMLIEHDYGARTNCYDKVWLDENGNRTNKTSPKCGYITFTKEQWYMDTITHECTHAVVGYFARKLTNNKEIFDEIDPITHDVSKNHLENEELFCYMIGNLSDQVVGGLEKVSK